MNHSTARDQHRLNSSHPLKLIRIRTVIELTGLSKAGIYNLLNQGLFPQSVRLVPGGTSVAWVESEIMDWINNRIQSREL